MKAFRTVGSILSSIVAILLVLVLFVTLVSAGICAVVSEDTIEKLSNTLVKDEQVQTIAKEALKNISIGGSAPLSDEKVDALLSSTAVQEGLSKIAAETITAAIKEDGEIVDVTDTVIEIISAEPELFNDVLQNILMTEDTTYDEIFEGLTGVTIGEGGEIPTAIENPLGADLPPITIPEYGASLSELATSWIEQNPDAVNDVIRQYVGEGFSLGDLSGYLNGGNIDYALGENGETPEIGEGEMGITSIEADEDPTTVPGIALLSDGFSPEKLIDSLRQLLDVSPVAVLGIALGLLAAFYLLTALLTWSFRRPLVFVGIVSVLGGILTLALSFVPVLGLLSSASAQLPEIAVMAVELIWTLLQSKLLIYGIIFAGLGVVLFVLSFLIPKKKRVLAD